MGNFSLLYAQLRNMNDVWLPYEQTMTTSTYMTTCKEREESVRVSSIILLGLTDEENIDNTTSNVLTL